MNKKRGRPALPLERKLRRRPIGLRPAQWDWLRAQATRGGVSVDEIIRRLVAGRMA